MLFCAFLPLASFTLTDVRRANVEQSLLRPSSFQKRSSWPQCDAFQSNSHSLFTFFRKRASPGLSHAPSFNSSSSCLAAHFFQYTDRALCTSIFLTSLGHTYLMSILLSSLKINECQCDYFMPRSRVSHITAPAGPLTCFPHLNFLNLPHPRFFLFVMPFPVQAPSAQN